MIQPLLEKEHLKETGEPSTTGSFWKRKTSSQKEYLLFKPLASLPLLTPFQFSMASITLSNESNPSFHVINTSLLTQTTY